MYENELYHYGVKGMKWGVRKKSLPTSSTRNKLDSAKAEYKSAMKAGRKSFAKAYTRSLSALSPSKKQRQRNAERWVKVNDDVNKINYAKANYKNAKNERKTELNVARNNVERNTSIGDRLFYNDATRRKAAKYVVDNNMSVAEATKKAKGEAKRNTAIMLAAYGAVTVGSMALEKYR